MSKHKHLTTNDLDDLTNVSVLRDEVVPCLADQWNFPHPRDRPWVRESGACVVCGEVVAYERLRPVRPNMYSCIAMPHTRVLRWYAINEDDLRSLIDYRNNW